MVPDDLRAEERQFIESIAELLAPWGMSLMSGRVYGYILLNQGTVSVNQIAAALGTSNVAAWNAARSLEAFGHVRRYGEQGSKRALYGPTDNFDAPFVKRAELLGALAKQLRGAASSIVRSRARGRASTGKGSAPPRLRAMARFYVSMQRAMATVIQELNADKVHKNEP
jgi:DNA-binding Lrp family transcriptional regulator